MPKCPVKRSLGTRTSEVHRAVNVVCTQSVDSRGIAEARELGDTYTRSDFYVPGVLLVTDRGYPRGTADKPERQEPNLERPPIQPILHWYRR